MVSFGTIIIIVVMILGAVATGFYYIEYIDDGCDPNYFINHISNRFNNLTIESVRGAEVSG